MHINVIDALKSVYNVIVYDIKRDNNVNERELNYALSEYYSNLR